MKTFLKNFKLTKNKSLEIQLNLLPDDDYQLFNVNINHTLKGDHAGFEFRIESFKVFCFYFLIYDTRHWDDENDCWKKYEIEDHTDGDIQKLKCTCCGTKISNSMFVNKFKVNGNLLCKKCISENLDYVIENLIIKG